MRLSLVHESGAQRLTDLHRQPSAPQRQAACGRAESPKPRRSCPRSYGWSSSSAVIVIASVCFFADADEPWFPQVAMIAATAIIVVSGLLLVRFLGAPYENQSGSIKPTAMARSL